MAFDFPSSPTAGQEFTPSGGPTYVWESPRWLPKGVIPGVTISDTPPSSPVQGQLWLESDSGNLFASWNDGDSTAWVQVSGSVAATPTAEARNRIVNPCFQISQENGNTASTIDSYYLADQWMVVRLTTGTITVQRVQSVTPRGSQNRLRATVTVADAVLDAADLLSFCTPVEGTKIADFKYGIASAKQSVLRFGFKAPAGTYSISLKNPAGSPTYVANFTISAGQANTDTEHILIIPGATTGTWGVTATTLGLTLFVTVAAGTAFHAAPGWGSGGYGTSANTGNMATAGAVYELFDVGLYLDPLATGVPPLWVMPDEADELRACQRYWFRQTDNIIFGTYATAANYTTNINFPYKQTMRIVPAISIPVVNYNNSHGINPNATTTSATNIGLAADAAGQFLCDFTYVASARM